MKRNKLLIFILVLLMASTALGQRVERAWTLFSSQVFFGATVRPSNSVGGSIDLGTSSYYWRHTYTEDVYLENGEIISNGTDGDVLITFDDDAATLGQFIVASSVDSPNTANNDLFEIVFKAENDSTVTFNVATIQAKITDITDDTEDSQIIFKTQDAGTEETTLTLGDGTLTLTNSETIDNETDGTIKFTDGTNTLASIVDGGSTGNLSVTGSAMFPLINYLADTSTANDTYGGTITPAPTALTTGMLVVFMPAYANTGAATLEFNGLTAKSIKTASGADPANDDIVTSTVCLLVYDGTNWVLLNPATTCD